MIPSPLTKSLLIRERLPELRAMMEPCRLCPRACGANRLSGAIGKCGVGSELVVSSIGLHFGEEPPISGYHGSGTVFLSGCNLHCRYCQNWTISQSCEGEAMTAREVAGAMLALQAAGAHNINWVSPTHVVPLLLDALRRAYDDGLSIPLVYNSGGYDSLAVLELLDGIVDIYMPDMKYGDADTAHKLSGVDEYPQHNQAAVAEMYRQVGALELDETGVAKRGLLVRHLVLPEGLADSELIFDFLESLGGPVDINVMDQYRPSYRAAETTTLNRALRGDEFATVVAAAGSRPHLRLIE